MHELSNPCSGAKYGVSIQLSTDLCNIINLLSQCILFSAKTPDFQHVIYQIIPKVQALSIRAVTGFQSEKKEEAKNKKK